MTRIAISIVVCGAIGLALKAAALLSNESEKTLWHQSVAEALSDAGYSVSREKPIANARSFEALIVTAAECDGALLATPIYRNAEVLTLAQSIINENAQTAYFLNGPTL